MRKNVENLLKIKDFCDILKWIFFLYKGEVYNVKLQNRNKVYSVGL